MAKFLFTSESVTEDKSVVRISTPMVITQKRTGPFKAPVTILKIALKTLVGLTEKILS